MCLLLTSFNAIDDIKKFSFANTGFASNFDPPFDKVTKFFLQLAKCLQVHCTYVGFLACFPKTGNVLSCKGPLCRFPRPLILFLGRSRASFSSQAQAGLGVNYGKAEHLLPVAHKLCTPQTWRGKQTMVNHSLVLNKRKKAQIFLVCIWWQPWIAFSWR